MKLFCLFTLLLLYFSTVVAAIISERENATTEARTSQKQFATYGELARAVRDSLAEHERASQRQRWPHNRSKRAVKRVCYGELGCFEDSGPFTYLEMLPSTPEEINTKFYFYSTRDRSDRPLMELPFLNMTAAFRGKSSTTLAPDTTALPQRTTPPAMASTNGPTLGAEQHMYKKPAMTIDELEGFDELAVRVIVHGFGSACRHAWIYEIKTALMAVEDCIVICVNWEMGANFPNYVRAAANTRLVGKQLAMLLRNLQTHKGLNLTRTHIIGFSLGAHVSGFAGAELPGLSRITGLDPAGPLFEAQHPKVRLDSNDADFVDVIHSNGENLILGGLGSWQPMGHVDYYPNGGRVQTGCSNLFVGAVTDFIWSGQAAEDEEGRSLCNHRRAYKFFIDSVAPRCMFPAFPCANYDDFLKGKCFPCAQDDKDLEEGVPRCGNMGYYANRSTGRGQLYLVTREEEPFCAHQFQLQIFNSFNDLPLRTIGRLEAILEGDVGLNETFEISEKDDAEFFAGDIVSKIIVPHPALGFPTKLSLHYKSYSGWLSKGLPHWDIDKVVLTDSFGRSHSLCKPSTKLSSGSPVRLLLLPGNCELDNQDEYGAYTTTTTSAPAALLVVNASSEVPDSSALESVGMAVGIGTDSVESAAKQSKDVFNLGTSFKLTQNQTYPIVATDMLPWQPVLEGNSLDKEVGESSRSLNVNVNDEQAEIFEPILKHRRMGINRGRNLQHFVSTTEEIMEPVLKATTPRIKKAKKISLDSDSVGDTIDEPLTTTKSNSNKTSDVIRIKLGKPSKQATNTAGDEQLTVQLLPFRLGDLLQRAERYARETLLPLISVQAPRFFGFNVTGQEVEVGGSSTLLANVEPKSESRKPRYIPRYEEAAFLNNDNNNDNDSINTTAYLKRESKLKPSGQDGQQQRNLLRLTRTDVADEQHRTAHRRSSSSGVTNMPPTSARPATAPQHWPKNEVTYYTNMLLTRARAMRPEDPEYEPVFIDLPTYRPPRARVTLP